MDLRTLARNIAEESIVLLKNEENLLPFPQKKKLAVFGRMQIDLIYSGSGSGAASAENCKNILEACEEQGFLVEQDLKQFYQKRFAEDSGEKQGEFDLEKLKDLINSGLMYEFFGKYKPSPEEYEVPEELYGNAEKYTDTALLILGRNSGGEECDRHLYDDYYLTAREKKLIDEVNTHFRNVVLVLNINGLVDLSWLEEKKNIKSVLYLGVPGQEGAEALGNLLSGAVNPSGRLAFTIAKNYEDYPAAKHFSWDKEHDESILTYADYGLDAAANGSVGFTYSPVTVYQEDIYPGYRYFDTFDVEPLFPFGHGLSYTQFQEEAVYVKKKNHGVEIMVHITNEGKCAGKDVVQLYVSADTSMKNRPAKELKGFEKTGLIKPGKVGAVTLFVPWKELAYYDMDRAAYIIAAGEYTFLIGKSSRETVPVLKVIVKEEILTEQLTNCLSLADVNKGKITFLTSDKNDGNAQNVQNMSVLDTFLLTAEEVKESDGIKEGEKDNPFAGAEDKAEEVVKELSDEQLFALCVGYGPGIPFGGFAGGNYPNTTIDAEGNPLTECDHPKAFPGYASPAIKEKGIVSVFYKDGPAGIGNIAWPTEMLCACAFNKEIWYAFGNAAGEECEKEDVDFWLAPAVNMIRHPLGGRDFEYPSEDPYLAGVFGCQIAKGTQENHKVLVCPKHFAVNEQETYRRGSTKKSFDAVNSIIQERAAREIYLKPFEMMVKEANVRCIMSSFNRINGIFAGENKDLCTQILRNEWGYEGYVVTDWGDMDIVLDGANAVAAGNDIVMPGGPPVIAEIRKGFEEGRVSRTELEKAVKNLLGSNLRL